MRSLQASRETTGLIGARCKLRKELSRGVLTGGSPIFPNADLADSIIISSFKVNLHPIKFGNEEISFIFPKWQELEDLTFFLSQKIIKSKIKIDRLVTLAKGGWPMSRSLIDFLGIKEIASIGIKFYRGIGEKLKKPLIYQNIPVSIYREKVLLFDDVADTGYSLEFARRYLHDNGADKVYTATLFYKPSSKIKPDFYAFETSSWIIFPYEKKESIKLLKEMWVKKGLEEEEIKKRLREIGFTRKILEKFF